MRKLVLSSLIGILSFLFMSCAFTEGTVTIYNDSDIVERVVYLDNKSYSGDDTIVRFMYLTKGSYLWMLPKQDMNFALTHEE